MKKIIVEISLWILFCAILPSILEMSGISKIFFSLVSWDNPAFSAQFSMLAGAVIVILFRKEKWADFGFQWVNFKSILKVAVIAIIVSSILYFLNLGARQILGIVEESEHPMLTDSWINIVVTIMILASFSEELLFRGVLLRLLIAEGKSMKMLAVPNIIVALQFGLVHLPLLFFMNTSSVIYIVISAFILGLLAGYYRQKSGSILTAYIIHLMFNLSGMILPDFF